MSKKCGWRCNTGFTKVGSKCIKNRLAAAAASKKTTTTTKKKTTTTTRKVAASATANAAASSRKARLAAVGVTAFTGTNSGIGSWYRANSTADSTNGRSWCEFDYTNASPVFAPSVGTMRANFDGDNDAAATAYCGLEAKVTAPDGTSKIMVIGDGFDDKWVLSPGSIDIMHNSFTTLYGEYTSNKDKVIKGVEWTLTGNRNEKYAFRGQGDA